MRTLVLGTLALLLGAGCFHHGRLRLTQAAAAQVSEDGSYAITEAHGVRLVVSVLSCVVSVITSRRPLCRPFVTRGPQ